MRDRGARLAGYLTPPSDVTQEEEETASERVVVIPFDSNRFEFSLKFQLNFKNSIFSDRISQQTVLRIEPSWDNNNSAPALIKTKELEHKIEPITITRTDETKISTNKARVNCTNLFYEQQFNFLF